MAIIGGIATFLNALISCLTYPLASGVMLIFQVAGIVEEAGPIGLEEQRHIDIAKRGTFTVVFSK